MAQSIEEIKAELEAPTHRVVNGLQVNLTAEEKPELFSDEA